MTPLARLEFKLWLLCGVLIGALAALHWIDESWHQARQAFCVAAFNTPQYRMAGTRIVCQRVDDLNP